MSRSFHTIELNLPAHTGAQFPDPNKAPVVIDGTPFECVSAVSVTCDCGKPTEVAVTFFAEVTGGVTKKVYSLEGDKDA